MTDAVRRRLTVFLLQDVTKFADALDPEQKPREEKVTDGAGFKGRFYWQTSGTRTPDWVPFVSPALSQTPDVHTASSSGLLVLKSAKRFFAVTFGYGRSMLDQSKVVRQFGLKVVLNTINPEQIRSLDTKKFEDMVVATNTQASRSTTLSTFEVDAARDILRAVTGETVDTKLGKRLSGADAIVLNIATTVEQLPSVCKKLLKAYSSQEYKKNFAWVDDLAIVTDPTVVNQLDGAMLTQLRAKDTASTHLAMPDVIDWGELDSFKITGTRAQEYDDLDLDAYLALVPKVDTLEVDDLKRRRVQIKFARSENWDSRWALYQCLVSEQRTVDGLFVLIEGRWFRISDSLADQVDEYTKGLSTATVSFPPSFTGEKEADYNKRLARLDPGARICLDAKLVNPTGASSPLEVCDVLLADGTLVHVKRKSRSSTLSHLFAQGVVSMTTMLADGAFRDRVRTLIASNTDDGASWTDVVPARDKAIDRSQFRVSYVVIANSNRSGTDWLPFFSKLNLMQAVRTLRATHGIAVTIDRVDVVEAPSGEPDGVMEIPDGLEVDDVLVP